MSDQKQNKRKKENGETNTNKSEGTAPQTSNLSSVDEEQSYHTAPEYPTSDEENNQASSFVDTSSAPVSDDDELAKPKRQSFRSSISLHHLKTIKSTASAALQPRQPSKTSELTVDDNASQATILPSPEHSHLPTTAEVVPPTLALSTDKQPSKAVLPSDHSEQQAERPIQKRSSMRARFSTESPRRQSKRSLKNEESFRTNLNPGDAFVYMVLPPDGGYGWVIVFISFLVQIITDGIIFSIGIVLPDMAKDFGVEMTEAILISALQICFYYLSGPITSAFINKYGFRFVAMLGAALGCGCWSIASFSPNIEMLLIFYSILGGPCLAMTWVSSQLIIGYYFEKYRSIANGLSCSGSGAGLVIFVQLNTFLLPKVGWRNNARIQAGLLLVALLLSLAYAEVPPSKIGIIREQDPEHDVSEDELMDERETMVGTFNYADPTSVEPEERASDYLKLEKMPTKDLIALSKYKPSPFRKCLNKCLCCDRKRTSLMQEDESGASLTKRYVVRKDLLDRQDLYYDGPAEYTEQDHTVKHETIDGKDVELIDLDRPVHTINYSMSRVAAPKSEEIHKDSESKNSRCCYYLNPSNWVPHKIKKIFRILFNFSLFHIMEFRVLFVSAALFGLAFNIPFLFSKARLQLPEALMSYIPIFIGITNFSFRIICGFIAFKFKKHVIYLSGSAVALGGLACLTSAFYGNDNFWFQIAYASVFGVAPAFFSTLRAIIYVQYLGLENLTTAFGLVSMGMGIAILIGTMIGGFLNKLTGGYTAAFAFAGICILLSGGLKLILPYLSQHRLASRKVKFQV